MIKTTLDESLTLLSLIDNVRKLVNAKLDTKTKSALGQYMTPARIASFMASLFPMPSTSNIVLLDPGAGVGSLTSAFVERLCATGELYHIDINAYEIDPLMRSFLGKNLDLCKEAAARYGSSLAWHITSEDFIIDAAQKVASLNTLWPEKVTQYTHCIMNPPYKKLVSSFRYRDYLHLAGIEAVNAYSAFVALALSLLREGGYLVAILPRSFCNGPYYRAFRLFLLKNAALKRIHLFSSRNKVFRDDKILQENVIIVLEKLGKQGNVTVSSSIDDNFDDMAIFEYPFTQILQKDDDEFLIHIPTKKDDVHITNGVGPFTHTLSQIGVQVSTGPVVDFRIKEHLRNMPEKGTAPLLYPCHFKAQTTLWPIASRAKPNALIVNSTTQRWLYPNGYYTVVRRFSSKEETRRIVAGVVDPTLFKGMEGIGFENHLNIFHRNKGPLPEVLARGLFVFLNSTMLDNIFRRFSGHTQVNATDLRCIKYPSLTALLSLGYWMMQQKNLTQEMIDQETEKITK